MLRKAVHAFGGNGGIIRTNRVPDADAPVLMAIKHINSEM